MSTSALVKVEGVEGVALYVHADGYPESLGAQLETFNKAFEARRPGDPSYKFARLVQFLTNEYDKAVRHAAPYAGTLGFGLCDGRRGVGKDWADYRYTLCKGRIDWMKGR